MKTCSKCKEEKDESEFGKRKERLRSECKKCKHKDDAKYREENPEKNIIKYLKNY